MFVEFIDLKTLLTEPIGIEKIYRQLFHPKNQLELKSIISDGDTVPEKLAKTLRWNSETDDIDCSWVK